ncbi:MAG: hypothetical protein ACOX19_12840 [Fermentimonas sp.]|jgi:hypothetical protein
MPSEKGENGLHSRKVKKQGKRLGGQQVGRGKDNRRNDEISDEPNNGQSDKKSDK